MLLAVAGFALPAHRLNEFLASLGEPGWNDQPGFWWFSGLFALAGVCTTFAYLVLARQRMDSAERARALGTGMSTPLLILGVVVAGPFGALLLGTSLLFALAGQFRYAVAQGERGAFLSRFLSSQVADLVRNDGLAAVMQPGERDVTVVACDLRGFTSYAEASPRRR